MISHFYSFLVGKSEQGEANVSPSHVERTAEDTPQNNNTQQ